MAGYHGQVHATLGQPPAGRWAAAVAAGGAPTTVTNEKAFLVDFLPVVRRTPTPTPSECTASAPTGGSATRAPSTPSNGWRTC